MKITFEEAKEVAGRLPVGYYLGRKVPVVIDELFDGAKCDLVKHEIHIGLGLLNQAASHVDPSSESKWSREKILRCLLYHEIGHVLMSPSTIKGFVLIRDKEHKIVPWSDHIVNIFEDERIEQVLGSFFMGVDFRGFVGLVNGTGGKTGRGKEVDRFFSAVRQREAGPDILRAVDQTVKDLAFINSSYVGYEHRGFLAQYEKLVSDLYQLICESDEGESGKGGDGGESGGGDGKPDGESEPSPNGGEEPDDGKPDADDKPSSGGEESESETGDDGSPSGDDGTDDGKPDGDGTDCGSKDDEGSDGKPDGGCKPDRKHGEHGDDGEGKDGDGEDIDGEAPDVKSDGGSESDESSSATPVAGTPDDGDGDDGKHIPSLRGSLPSDMLEKLANEVFFTPTSEVSRALDRFAVRLSKKKGKQAAGRWSGLHGRIDTKRDAMGKERIFRRPSDVGDSLSSAVNLVLWVDVSGSFSRSCVKLNTILAAAAAAEKMSLGKLKVQVVKMGDDATVAEPNEWQVVCDQCNAITMTYYDAWVEARDRTRRNIDIVVLDGYAKSDEVNDSEEMPDGTPIEKKIWDSYDCHIICDRSNRKIFKDTMSKAHITYIDDSYAERLEKEVVKTLDMIL